MQFAGWHGIDCAHRSAAVNDSQPGALAAVHTCAKGMPLLHFHTAAAGLLSGHNHAACAAAERLIARPWLAEHVHTPAAQDFPAGATRKRPLIYV